MSYTFIPQAPCSRTFWPSKKDGNVSFEDASFDKPPLVGISPFTVYHVDAPHAIRKKHGHLGASPKCRANVLDSMELLRKVMQPAVNQDIFDAFQKYVSIIKKAAENALENNRHEPSTGSTDGFVDAENLAFKICKDLLENSKQMFSVSDKSNIITVTNTQTNLSNLSPHTSNKKIKKAPSPLPARMSYLKRAPSPDLSYKRNKSDTSVGIQRSYTPPPPRKRTRIGGPRRYGSPHRNNREQIKRDGPTWDPNHLTLESKFVMGTKANKALGLGATRGRIYMKHPELFKYAGDPEDKKWMVKNNCMAATGGKNTFILLAEDVDNLLNTEYKDSPGLMHEELDYFQLPEFILQKMRVCMIHEKKLAESLQKSQNTPTPSPLSGKSSPSPAKPATLLVKMDKSPKNSKKRNAAKVAEYAITASQQHEEDDVKLHGINSVTMGKTLNKSPLASQTTVNSCESDSTSLSYHDSDEE